MFFCWSVSSEHPKRDLALNDDLLFESVKQKPIYNLVVDSDQE